MKDRSQCAMLTVLGSCVVVAALGSGCASLRKQKIVPESIAACRQLSSDGVAAMEMGQSQRARELLTQAVETSPTDIDARRHLAEVLWENGARQDAAVQIETAVRLDPRHAPTVVRSGEMLLGIGVVDRSLERAKAAIALDSNLAEAWALRGRVYRQQGKAERALADFQQALRYAPQARDTLLEVAELQYDLGRPQRSLITLHYLLDTYSPGEEPQRALWLEGLAHGALQRHQDAVESLYAASLRGEPQAELLYALAQAENAAGRPDAATNIVRQALSIDASHQPSQVLMARLQGIGATDPNAAVRR